MAFQGDSIFWVEVEKIVPNPFQPRREFDEEKLKELAESVRMYGILQPLTVTRREIQNEDGSFRSEYELIAGERRLRASKLAGVSQVPVIIREGEQSEQEKLELAIIENLQREDLNAVDRAIAFRQLADVFGLSHSQVAKKMGRSREYVSNSIRILGLPDYMLTAIRTNDINEGHGRALLMLNDRPEEQDTVFRELLLKKLSVRDVERIVRSIATDKVRKKNEHDSELREIEKQFTETLGTRVSITRTDFGGRLSIDYFTQEDLEEFLSLMTRTGAEGQIKKSNVFAPASYPTEVEPDSDKALGQPYEQELAILTERTGLEVVPDRDVSITLPLGASPEVMASVPQSNIEPVQAVATPVTENVIANQEGQNNFTETTPEVMNNVSEAESNPVIVPAAGQSLREQLQTLLSGNQTASPSREEVVVPLQSEYVGSVSDPAAKQDSVTHASDDMAIPVSIPAPDAPVVNREATKANVITEKIATEPEDDSNLYSMRDFSI